MCGRESFFSAMHGRLWTLPSAAYPPLLVFLLCAWGCAEAMKPERVHGLLNPVHGLCKP
jgi:hypothetical protein